MIKKHLSPPLIIILLFVVATVFAYQMPLTQTKLSSDEKVTVKSTITNPIEVPVSQEPTSLMDKLNFAQESLPTGDKRIEQKMKKTLAAHSFGNLQTHRLHRKAAEWFPIIEPILAAHGIPNDFKYVVLVESGMKSGVSPKGASGVWQFMPATARLYGLKVNAKIDERNNLKKSTVAAAKYIKDMYKVLNSWTLAAAAYNVGGGRLSRQMDSQNQNNYYKLKLNKETGAYVYKIISMKQIMEHPVRYGYKKPKAADDYVIE